MSIYDWALLAGALIAAALSWRSPRALLWILAGATDFAVSTLYWRSGLPYGEAVGGICDAMVCLALYFGAKDNWELMIYRLFQISLAVNILFLAGNLGIFYRIDTDALSALLELLNWLVLALIGGIGTAQLVGASGGYALRPRSRFHRALRALFAPREADHFLSRKR